MDPIKEFQNSVVNRIKLQSEDSDLKNATHSFMEKSIKSGYSYNFSWLGRPVIQYPQDIVALQEIVWEVKPDLIIETGIAHGGSLILSASMLALLDICEAINENKVFDPNNSKRKVLGIDIDIRSHNRKAIESHPMSSRIEMIEGSSIASEVVSRVKDYAKKFNRILVCLDSNHTHEHVLAELEAYAELTSKGSYCIVFDTIVENMSDDMFTDRNWSIKDNPKTAVWEYLKTHSNDFVIDTQIHDKLQITVAPDGYLKRL